MSNCYWTFKRHFILSLLITIITVFSDFVSAGAFGNLTFLILMKNITEHLSSEVGSVGVIGGIDGPTSFFLCSSPLAVTILSRVVLLSILLLLYTPTRKYLLIPKVEK